MPTVSSHSPPSGSFSSPVPTRIVMHEVSRILEIEFVDGVHARLPFEFLRVLSPSAEVKGHGPGQEVLQVGKEDVTITSLEPVGNYALQPTFSDGHDTGIYSWSYLHELATDQARLWSGYLKRLEQAGITRQAGSASATAASDLQVVRRSGAPAADSASTSGSHFDGGQSNGGQGGFRTVSRPR